MYIIVLIVSGVFVGICSGLLGIGGGVIMVPLMRLCLGFDAHISSGTSLFSIVPTSAFGSITHFRQGTCIPMVGLLLGLGGAVTSTLGVKLGAISPGWLIMAVTAVIIGYSAYTMLCKALKMPKRQAGSSRRRGQTGAVLSGTDSGNRGCTSPATGSAAKHGPSAPQASSEKPAGDTAPLTQEFPRYQLTAKRVLGALGVGIAAGIASGYCGVGGGFIMVPLMTAFLSVPMKQASGTSLIAIIILGIPGAISQALLGNVAFVAGILLVAGSIPGAVLGAKFNRVVPERELRFTFAIFLAFAALSLVLNELAVF